MKSDYVDTSPSGLVISAIKGDEKRKFVKSLFQYFLNTQPGWRPSDAARHLASMSLYELQRYRTEADAHVAADRARDQHRAATR